MVKKYFSRTYAVKKPCKTVDNLAFALDNPVFLRHTQLDLSLSMSRTLATLVLAFAIFASLVTPTQAAITSNLTIGSRGAQVTELQQKLSALGYFSEQATGYFGFVTLRAVIAYQRANNLFAAGWVGPQTRDLLNRVSGGSTGGTTTPAPGPTLVFTADKTSITAGESVRLTWDSSDATRCQASGDWTGLKTRDGSNRISRIKSDRTFTLTCTGKTGTVSQSVHVSVVESTPEETPEAPTLTVSADKSSVVAGGSATVTWSAKNVNSCTGTGGFSGTLSSSGKKTVSPTQAQSYGLTCTGEGGTVSQSVTIAVTAAPVKPAAPTLTLSISKNVITAGDTTTLSWTSTNASSCSASGAWSGSKGVSGSESVTPTSNATYTLTCTGEGGTVTKSVATVVNQPTPAPTLFLNASASSIISGSGVTLSWSSANASSCTASGGWSGSKATSGSQALTLTSAQSFTLTCTGTGGSVTKNVSVGVTQPAAVPTLTLTSSSASIVSGQSATLSWASTNASSCTASGSWTGSKSTSGTQTVSPTANATYTVACTGAGGTVTKSVSVTVTQPTPAPTVTFTSDKASIVSGQSANLSWTATNATQCTAGGGWWGGDRGTNGTQIVYPTSNATYTITCVGTGGTVTKSVAITVTQPAAAPTLSISFDKTSVTSGQLTTLYWETTNATTCTGTGAWTGQKVLLGGLAVYPTSNQTYTLTCTGAGGSVTKSATVSVTAAPTPAPTVTLSSNTTSVASGGSATLTWSTTNATACTASGGWSGSKATSGTQSLTNLTSSQAYTLTCTGAGGSANKSVTINVTTSQTVPAPTVTFTSDKSSMTSGSNATLTWSTTNATSCTASGSWSGTKSTSGTQSVSPTSNATYTLACVGTGGSASKNVSITVSSSQSSSGQPRQWVGVATDNSGNANGHLDAFTALLGRNPDMIWANSDHSAWWAMDASLGGNFNGGYGPVKLAISRNIPILWTIPLLTAEGNLADAAAGKYNEYYKGYARTLIANHGTSKTIYVRPNNEFNGTWMPWSVASGQEANSAEAFRQYVNSFRSVSNNFKFEWNVQLAWDSGTNVPATYPGDSYVDYIGGDMYYFYLRGHPTNETEFWNWLVNHKVGLNWLSSFAAQHGKPIAISEWGLDTDQPAWINHMSNWIKSNNVAYQIYWSRNDDAGAKGSLTDGSRPQSAAAYKSHFGNGPISATERTNQLASALTALENLLNQLTVKIGR